MNLKNAKYLVERALNTPTRKLKKIKRTVENAIRSLNEQQQYGQLTVGNIPNINVTGPQTQQITWSGATGVGPVYISYADVASNTSIAQIGMPKTGGNSFTWNIDCGMAFPPGGIAKIFVAKMAQGYSGPYDPSAAVAYGYSNDFNLTDSCSFSGIKPPATSPKPKRRISRNPRPPRGR